MQTATKPKPRFDVERIADDMATRTWNALELARNSGLSPQTVSRFLSSEVQTPKTAGKIAAALGYSVRRYLISAKDRRNDDRRRQGERRDGDRRAEV